MSGINLDTYFITDGRERTITAEYLNSHARFYKSLVRANSNDEILTTTLELTPGVNVSINKDSFIGLSIYSNDDYASCWSYRTCVKTEKSVKTKKNKEKRCYPEVSFVPRTLLLSLIGFLSDDYLNALKIITENKETMADDLCGVLLHAYYEFPELMLNEEFPHESDSWPHALLNQGIISKYLSNEARSASKVRKPEDFLTDNVLAEFSEIEKDAQYSLLHAIHIRNKDKIGKGMASDRVWVSNLDPSKRPERSTLSPQFIYSNDHNRSCNGIVQRFVVEFPAENQGEEASGCNAISAVNMFHTDQIFASLPPSNIDMFEEIRDSIQCAIRAQKKFDSAMDNLISGLGRFEVAANYFPNFAFNCILLMQNISQSILFDPSHL